MLTKYASTLYVKFAVDQDIKDALKSNKVFREAWRAANAAGGSIDDLNNLYRQHVNPKWQSFEEASRAGRSTGAGFRGGAYSAGAGSGFRRGTYGFGFDTDGFANMYSAYKKSQKAKALNALKWNAASYAGVGLGTYAAAKIYDYFKEKKKREPKAQQFSKAASILDSRLLHLVVPATSAASGAVSAAMLNKKERKAILDRYKLPEDTNLVFRNAMRGLGGAAVGSALYSAAHLTSGVPPSVILEYILPSMLSELASSQYTPDNAKLILKQDKSKLKELQDSKNAQTT